MKQQCNLWSVWLTWLVIPVLALYFGLRIGAGAGIFVLLVGIVAEVAYLRYFPRISRWIGYGSVADEPASTEMEPLSRKVRLYTANVCPFCPLVRRRLAELQHQLGFELEEVDVTFRPDLVNAKGIWSVPAIEVDGRFWVGNATSAQLAAFLLGETTAP